MDYLFGRTGISLSEISWLFAMDFHPSTNQNFEIGF